MLSGIVSSIFGGGTRKAMRQGNALMERMFEAGKEQLTPYAQGGQSAFGAMGGMLGLNGGPAQTEGFNNYMNSTGFQFLLDSGSRAITGSNAAKGLRTSGATAQALTRFGQNLAATKTAEYMQLLQGMSQTGANAAGNIAGAGNQMAQNVATNRMNNANNMADAWGSVANLGLAIAGSDRRIKQFIRKVGELTDGLGIYVYRYISGGPLQWGVMADEVARLRPEALGPTVGEFQTVNYSKL